MSLTSTQKKENNIVELEIAVDGEQLKKATDAVFRRKVKTITVPGFRKGKAPRGIIEKMYGEGIFLEDAVNDLFPGAYEAAVEESGIEPVDQAKVEVLTLDKETGFTFKATVTVKPDITVKAYKGIKADKVIYTVKDEDVNTEIDKMQERNARTITVEGRPAQNDDMTVIDFEGFVDGVPFEGGKGEGHQLTLGSGQFIPGFEEQIVGHNVGDEFDVNVTFPEEYHAEELKGAAAVFKVKLHEIKAKELPVMDDEFAKDVSEFDTMDELKKDIREHLEKDAEKRTAEEFENALMEQIIEGVEGEIPECMYDNKVSDMARDFEYRLSSQGMNMDLYLQYTGMDMDAFRGGFRPQAERQVKIRLALEKIAQLENIEVSQEELDAEISKIAESYQMDVEKVKGIVPEKDLTMDIKCTKAIDVIRDSAVANEKSESDGEEKPKKKAKAKAKSEDEEKAAPKKAKTTKKAKAEDGEEKPAKTTRKKATKKDSDAAEDASDKE